MSWTPDETPAELWLDRISLIGAELADVAYGVHVTLFFLCFNAWWSARRHSPRGAYSTIAFISCIFVLGSVGIAASMRIQQLAYIDDSNFPGGPGAFESVSGYMKINVFGFSAYTVNAWFADGLLLYRFYILWSTSRHRWAVIPPFLAYLLSIISSSILLAQMAVPGGALWLSTNANMALTFWSASISVTCYCTLGIIIKLLYMRYQVRKAFGGGEQLPYFSVAAMLIESALLYAAFALAFLVTYALSNRISFMLISILGQAQSIAPLLIVLRVAQGRGWTLAKVRETERLAMGTHGTQTLQFHRTTHSTVDESGTTPGATENVGEMEFAGRSVATLPKKASTSQLERVADIVAGCGPNEGNVDNV